MKELKEIAKTLTGIDIDDMSQAERQIIDILEHAGVIELDSSEFEILYRLK